MSEIIVGEKKSAKRYSHSKLSSFEQCQLKYKFRYIDKIKPDFEKSIEAHLGTCVHETLEWVYKTVMAGSLPTLDAVVEHYAHLWEEQFDESMKIAKADMNAKNYFNKGVDFLVGYYVRHQPFKEGTIDLEMEILVDLDNSGKYQLVGYIDRLAFNEKSQEYEIHDYKTGAVPPKEKLENDRQLALYSMAIKEIFGKEKKVCLIWHYLAQDMKFCVYKTNEQLEKLKQDMIVLINKIESMNEYEFKPNPSILCNWCEYKSSCPIFNLGQSKL